MVFGSCATSSTPSLLSFLPVLVPNKHKQLPRFFPLRSCQLPFAIRGLRHLPSRTCHAAGLVAACTSPIGEGSNLTLRAEKAFFYSCKITSFPNRHCPRCCTVRVRQVSVLIARPHPRETLFIDPQPYLRSMVKRIYDRCRQNRHLRASRRLLNHATVQYTRYTIDARYGTIEMYQRCSAVQL